MLTLVSSNTDELLGHYILHTNMVDMLRQSDCGIYLYTSTILAALTIIGTNAVYYSPMFLTTTSL